MKLRGVVPPIGTPLTDGDRVDEPGLRRLARYLLDAKVHGIFANGSMGGFAFLTDDEQIRSIETTVSEVNGACPVLGGLGDTSTSRAVRMAKRIAAEGVDYLTVLPPFYFLTSQEQVIAYFCEIAASVDVPLFLYDNPVLTKCNMAPETMFELRRRIPSLAGVKISDSDFFKLQRVAEMFQGDDGFAVMTGSEFVIVPALQLGCDGYVGGSHNLCPHMAVALWDAFQAGQLERARELQRDMIAAWQVFRRGAIWGAFDEALRYLGICERATGAPYVTAVTDQERHEIHEILDQYVKPYLAVV
ncbi:MAG: dihydrodipicolinate synthase family protein [Bryobacterales bacterium]|nr:dihydrodipicolinate synthase family protein [Bryobacterales bacterium]